MSASMTAGATPVTARPPHRATTAGTTHTAAHRGTAAAHGTHRTAAAGTTGTTHTAAHRGTAAAHGTHRTAAAH
ncbi:MAG: hypothetical protein IKF77_08455 [Thermoguttaceae bacterium]|nr:hypothetical protein [Thermoguttaceae bacterium]